MYNIYIYIYILYVITIISGGHPMLPTLPAACTFCAKREGSGPQLRRIWADQRPQTTCNTKPDV